MKGHFHSALAIPVVVGLVCGLVLTFSIFSWYDGPAIRPQPTATAKALSAPLHVAAFADAQCRRDAAGLVANAANLSLEAVTPAIAQATKCSGVRYLGSAHTSIGVHYIFVLTDADDANETWWVYSTNDDGLVTGIQ